MDKYLANLQEFQKKTIDFLNDCSITIDENNHFFNYLKEAKFDNNHVLKLILHFISNLSNNHHKNISFIKKIEAIILFLKPNITQYFSNDTIFNIFKGNKRILLFLLEEKIIIPNEYFVNIITNSKYSKKGYPNYFISKIKNYISKELYDKIEIENQNLEDNSLSFEERRKIGENDSFICTLIRNDSYEKFISHVNLMNVPLTSTIEQSIFETNPFLIDKQPSLIEYAAFCGSIQIFKYLHLNKLKENESLWYYAIHSNNPEIIHILEENNSSNFSENFYFNCFKEAMKCHHNEIADYFLNNFIEYSKIDKSTMTSKCLKYYNFDYFPTDCINEFFFDDLCRYDYIYIVDFLLKTSDININSNTIQNTNFYRI